MREFQELASVSVVMLVNLFNMRIPEYGCRPSKINRKIQVKQSSVSTSLGLGYSCDLPAPHCHRIVAIAHYVG